MPARDVSLVPGGHEVHETWKLLPGGHVGRVCVELLKWLRVQKRTYSDTLKAHSRDASQEPGFSRRLSTPPFEGEGGADHLQKRVKVIVDDMLNDSFSLINASQSQ